MERVEARSDERTSAWIGLKPRLSAAGRKRTSTAHQRGTGGHECDPHRLDSEARLPEIGEEERHAGRLRNRTARIWRR